jgi:hypothetical protein
MIATLIIIIQLFNLMLTTVELSVYTSVVIKVNVSTVTAIAHHAVITVICLNSEYTG